MKQNNWLFIFIGLMLITGLTFILMHFWVGPIESVRAINSNHNPALDFIFSWLTLLGEVWGMLICLLILLANKAYKWAIFAGLSFGLSGVLTYINKFHLFPNSPRPRSFLNDDSLIHFIEGVSINLNNSFPSGHTLVAATAATILACYFAKNINMQVLLWIMASLAGFSRVYLFQHFFIDVATSIFLALFVNIALVYLLRNWLSPNPR